MTANGHSVRWKRIKPVSRKRTDIQSMTAPGSSGANGFAGPERLLTDRMSVNFRCVPVFGG